MLLICAFDNTCFNCTCFTHRKTSFLKILKNVNIIRIDCTYSRFNYLRIVLLLKCRLEMWFTWLMKNLFLLKMNYHCYYHHHHHHHHHHHNHPYYCLTKCIHWLLCFLKGLRASFTFVLSGPWFVGEMTRGHLGALFVHGMYVKGHWIPGSLSYYYGIVQVWLFYLFLFVNHRVCMGFANSLFSNSP